MLNSEKPALLRIVIFFNLLQLRKVFAAILMFLPANSNCSRFLQSSNEDTSSVTLSFNTNFFISRFLLKAFLQTSTLFSTTSALSISNAEYMVSMTPARCSLSSDKILVFDGFARKIAPTTNISNMATAIPACRNITMCFLRRSRSCSSSISRLSTVMTLANWSCTISTCPSPAPSLSLLSSLNFLPLLALHCSPKYGFASSPSR